MQLVLRMSFMALLFYGLEVIFYILFFFSFLVTISMEGIPELLGMDWQFLGKSFWFTWDQAGIQDVRRVWFSGVLNFPSDNRKQCGACGEPTISSFEADAGKRRLWGIQEICSSWAHCARVLQALCRVPKDEINHGSFFLNICLWFLSMLRVQVHHFYTGDDPWCECYIYAGTPQDYPILLLLCLSNFLQLTKWHNYICTKIEKCLYWLQVKNVNYFLDIGGI